MTTHRRASRRRRSEEGAGLVEYMLLLSLSVVVCLVSLGAFGDTRDSRFSSVASNAVTGAP